MTPVFVEAVVAKGLDIPLWDDREIEAAYGGLVRIGKRGATAELRDFSIMHYLIVALHLLTMCFHATMPFLLQILPFQWQHPHITIDV